MKRCIVLDDYQAAASRSADWSSLSPNVEVSFVHEHVSEVEALVDLLGDAQVIVLMRERTPFPAELLRRLPNLELLVTTGMRNASIDLSVAQSLGITVCGTGTSASPPLELTWALLLGLARQTGQEDRAFRGGGSWQSSIGADLAGATLGIIGLGKIGSEVARVATAFGMRPIAWSPNLTKEKAQAAGVEFAPSKEELLENSRFVTLHMVLSGSTRNLIGEAELRKMRADAYLINTSRAGLVDQTALVRALEAGWIAGAGLDVYETEPLPFDNPFRRLPNVLALPHLGYVSENNYRKFYGEAVEDIQSWLSGAPIRVLG